MNYLKYFPVTISYFLCSQISEMKTKKVDHIIYKLQPSIMQFVFLIMCYYNAIITNIYHKKSVFFC